MQSFKVPSCWEIWDDIIYVAEEQKTKIPEFFVKKKVSSLCEDYCTKTYETEKSRVKGCVLHRDIVYP